jgi:hypothetical protein
MTNEESKTTRFVVRKFVIRHFPHAFCRLRTRARQSTRGEFRLAPRGYCPTPGAKSSEYRPTATLEPVSGQRLAMTRWGEIERISPRMKKEKKFAEAKSHVWRTPMGTNRYWSLRGAFQHQKELIYGLSGLKYDPVFS